jgi:hypothetical protein
MGLTKVKQKLAEKKHEVAEKVNPLSSTHKKERLERKTEQAELRKTEIDALKKERKAQAEARGKARAKGEFHQPKQTQSAPRRSSGGRRRSSGGGRGLYNSSNVPEYHEAYEFVQPGAGFATPDAWGNFNNRSNRPRQTQGPTKTTTVRSGNQTITVREKQTDQNQQSQQQNQQPSRQPAYDFPDVLGLDPTPQGRSNRNISNLNKRKKKEYDPFFDFM